MMTITNAHISPVSRAEPILDTCLGMSLRILLFFSPIFLSGNSFISSLLRSIFARSLATITSYRYIPKLHTNIIVNYSYTARPNVLIVLLEYIDLFNPIDSMKQLFGRGYPVFTILYCCIFILSMAIIIN